MTASILVVDDQPAMQDALNTSLVSEGYRVATAGSGEEALTRIAEQEFDIVLTDIVMPGLDGLEVLERSRLLNPRLAVIVMTAYATLETAITALRRGACDYLEKPFSLDELTLRVRRLLQSRGAIPYLGVDPTAPGGTRRHDLREAVRRFERQHLLGVLAETRFDKRKAADLLGISLASLYRKLGVR